MACTTILAGKNATYDGSTFIARNDDTGTGSFDPKKFVVVNPEDQPRKYVSTISKVEIELPDNPLRYTAMPDAVQTKGIWAAAGANEENVAMTATETITSNALVQGADPLVKAGIGEEDIVVLTLPYIHSAREGVLRLGSLLEKYGTYEMNGIAFSDADEVWWLESIGGHHWIARRLPDDCYAVIPNQLGLDEFDLDDALGEGRQYLCSKDLSEFIRKAHLDLRTDGEFNARVTFGSHADSDYLYNTPRAWAALRHLNPTSFIWDGDNADFQPECDNLPWCMVPERKLTVEDVKRVLSDHYQGTKYDPYARKGAAEDRGKYRPIGISRTSFLSLQQIRGYLPKPIQSVEWVAFGSNVFNSFAPFYTNVTKIPEYLSGTTGTVSTGNAYWESRLIGALADAHFNKTAIHIERYQDRVLNEAFEHLNHYDEALSEKADPKALEAANEVFASKLQKAADDALDHVLFEASSEMKNAFARSDA